MTQACRIALVTIFALSLNARALVSQELPLVSDSALCGCYTLLIDGDETILSIRLDSAVAIQQGSMAIHRVHVRGRGQQPSGAFWYNVGRDSIRVAVAPFISPGGAPLLNYVLARWSLTGRVENLIGHAGSLEPSSPPLSSKPARAIRVPCAT